jgi:hypothetical protein
MEPTLGRPAYIKPRSPMVAEAAALEKIASDLAHDLGVDVPPVILTDPPSGWAASSREVCASLVIYNFQLHWGGSQHGVKLPPGSAVKDDPNLHARAALLRQTTWGRMVAEAIPVAAARAFVFDAWVDQPDHNHPSNIVWGLDTHDPSRHGLCFFDYEMALGAGGWGPVAPVPFPEELLAGMDRREVAATVARVQGFAPETIHAIVDRVPSRFMNAARKTDVIQHLTARREHLGEALSRFLKSDA